MKRRIVTLAFLAATTLVVGGLTARGDDAAVKTQPLPLKAELAFPNLQWTGWSPVNTQGIPQPLRPIVVTHAGDDSGRLFVATQRGVIHVFPNRQDAKATKVFLDFQKQVVYIDKKNEEGLLGFAFHPKYKTDGRFFVYYTTTKSPQLSYVSSFRVSKDDPNRADPNSETVIMKIKQPFWNHNGGTLAFGPDGFLYVALGDGGAANDPYGNAQNTKTLLGSILRIDVDKKSKKRNYAIPKGNPFVGKRKTARPEIYAYGLRNVWRMSFDRQTGKLWAADVGQNLWEEINIIENGGNYGWNVREALHRFVVPPPKTKKRAARTKPRTASRRDTVRGDAAPRRADSKYIDPVWEYPHTIGKSITGGHVYRGKRLPALAGKYLYADYVSGKIWALDYNAKQKRVVGNHLIPGNKMPVITFGEDAAGEVYFCIVSPTGKGIYRFAKK